MERASVPESPFVSVVMPIRNEASFIARSLAAVLSQDYPEDRIEIIVADGMSTDATREIVRSLQPQHPNLVLIENPGKIVSSGLNAAIAKGRGEIFVRVDGHCEISKDYVTRCVEHLLIDGVQGVGGPLDTVGETSLSRAIALAMSSPFGVGGSAFRTVDRTMLTDTVPFPAYTRVIIDHAGPFDEELVRNQDDEYNCRLRKIGGKILLAADVRSRYYSRASFWSLWQQYFQYGYWKVRVMQKHPRQMRLRHFVPAIFVTTMIGMLFALFSVACYYFCLFIVGLYALSNAAGSLWAARKSGWRYLPFLPVAFTTLHMSYGFGFLVGLVKFWNRWGNTRNRVSAWGVTATKIDVEP